MIDPLPALLSVASTTPAPVAWAGNGVVSPIPFEQTLDAFLDARDAAPAEQAPVPDAPSRQGVAEDGKDLPAPASDDADTLDPAATPFWLSTLPAVSPGSSGRAPGIATYDAVVSAGSAISQPAATERLRSAIAVQQPLVAAEPVKPEGTPRPPAAHDRPTPLLQQSGDAPAFRVPSSLLDAKDGLPSSIPPPTVEPITDPIAHALLRFVPDIATTTTLAESSGPTLVRSDPVAQAIAVSAVPQPAAQVFAAALATAGSWRDRDSDGARTERSGANPFVAAPAVLEVRERAVVHAAADTAGTALDLTRDSGLQGMIDRIETLRDTADAGDTRVRLIPDALGSIDVAVRQEGERVHVRFTAEHDATRVLIAEAQPRLTELAAARGVRIGDTSVSTGTGGDNQPAPQPRPIPTFTRAPNRPARETESTTDHRLA